MQFESDTLDIIFLSESILLYKINESMTCPLRKYLL